MKQFVYNYSLKFSDSQLLDKHLNIPSKKQFQVWAFYCFDDMLMQLLLQFGVALFEALENFRTFNPLV